MNDRIEKLLEHVRVNEQIERLAKESGCTIDRLGFGEGNLEKFAKLIVRDCMRICKNIEYFEDTAFEPETVGHIRAGAAFCRDDIKEHFGIE